MRVTCHQFCLILLIRMKPQACLHSGGWGYTKHEREEAEIVGERPSPQTVPRKSWGCHLFSFLPFQSAKWACFSFLLPLLFTATCSPKSSPRPSQVTTDSSAFTSSLGCYLLYLISSLIRKQKTQFYLPVKE